MNRPAFAAVKLQTSDLSACESFFKAVFNFEVSHRYGGRTGDSFAEIVMTLPGDETLMLKFVQHRDQSANATGATIQIRLNNIEAAIEAATAAGAAVLLPATTYLEAGVRMAVITTDQCLDIELVQTL